MGAIPKNILVAVDGSAQSFEAVRYVGRLFPEGHLKATLFYVMDLIPESIWDLEWGLDLQHELMHIDAWEVQQRKAMEDFMCKASLLLESLGHGKSNIVPLMSRRRNSVVNDILEEACRGYDALVVGRYGLSPLRDLVFGSISSRIVSLLPRVPVWVIGGVPDPGRVLIAMDRSEGAGRALRHVGDVFANAQPEILLLHVSRRIGLLDPDFRQFVLVEAGRDWFEKADIAFRLEEQRSKAYLKQCVEELEKKGWGANRIRVKIVREAVSRSETIWKEAVESGFGTVVVGRRGLSRIDELVLGSVSGKILQLVRDRAVWVVH